MKVWELMRELEKAPAGSDVVIFNQKNETEYKISEASFDNSTIDAFTEKYAVSLYIGEKLT